MAAPITEGMTVANARRTIREKNMFGDGIETRRESADAMKSDWGELEKRDVKEEES